MTFVDGIKFWDRKEDVEKQKALASERNRLIQKMIGVKSGGGKTRPVKGRKSKRYHCDEADDEMRN